MLNNQNKKGGISYLDYTWNPISMKCTPVSEGCKNCWHLGILNRFNPDIDKPTLREKELYAPMKIKGQARIGVQFMGDLFHEDIPHDWHVDIFDKVICSPGNSYLYLTKRPGRMKESFDKILKDYFDHDFWMMDVWAGVSVENQRYENRIMELKDIQAAVRWVSFEPLIGPVNIIPSMFSWVNWVVIGCESGSGRRPCELEWINDIVNQCRAARCPVFVKQVPINGRVSHNPEEWPDNIAVREFPKN